MKEKISEKYIVFLTIVLTGIFTVSVIPLLAAEQERMQQQIQTQTQEQAQEQVYGSQLMTPQERNEYRARMSAAKTDEEREQIRMEHHERMKERAREQGVTIPDEPPGRGMGGMGPGGGMGSGGGMGPGGRNR